MRAGRTSILLRSANTVFKKSASSWLVGLPAAPLRISSPMLAFLKSYRWLFPSLLFTVAMLGLRVERTGAVTFCFLLWNLFLAAVPLFFSHLARRVSETRPFIFWACAAGWLLFFPNALYITTDLFHLRHRPPVPLWFDLLLLLSAAVNGALYGFLSLSNMEAALRARISRRSMRVIIAGLMGLCGFGIYLGRYLRYNSWDVAAAPGSLLGDIADHVLHPFQHIQAWGLTAAFAVWMYLLYRAFRRIGAGS